jgi:hypothetical protein
LKSDKTGVYNLRINTKLQDLFEKMKFTQLGNEYPACVEAGVLPQPSQKAITGSYPPSQRCIWDL